MVGGRGDRGCGDGGMVGGGGDRGCGDLAWLALWLFGSEVGCCNGVGIWLVQNNDRERKTLPQRVAARLTRRIPSKQRWGNLSEHKLSGITDLRSFMVFCKFPQP